MKKKLTGITEVNKNSLKENCEFKIKCCLTD